jgi:hypothetical protein
MEWIINDPPWGNLWRTVTTTFLLSLLISLPVAIFTNFDESGYPWTLALVVILLISFVVASVVVWSDRINWIGDR